MEALLVQKPVRGNVGPPAPAAFWVVSFYNGMLLNYTATTLAEVRCVR